MKYILALMIPLFIMSYNDGKSKKSESPINIINIKIIDEETKEELTGVKNNYQYSDFNGDIKVNKGDDIKLELISYNKVEIDCIKSDTTITMTKVK